MKEKEPEQNICPHCHFDQSTYVMPPYVLTPYTVLNGRYLVGKVLGKGGFGITYIAMDMMLERVVAIKEFFVQGYMYRDNSTSTSISVSTSAGDSQEQYYRLNREKFEREAKIIAHLDDLTGIVKVYDFFYENDTVYMVLEYLDGINLKEYVKAQGGKLNVNEVTSKLNSVMSSLQNLHEHGILHRDISPDNIMVLGDGSLKLLDFGGAKIQANTGLSNMVIAKKGYTPIEQYHTDGNQGVWTDVYAMAATIYFCITGQVPEESIQRVEKDTLKKPSELGVSMPKKQEAVLLKGLAVKGQDRYRSMEEFRRELLSTGGGKEKGPKTGSGNKKVVIGVAAAVVVVGAVAGIGFAGAKSKQPSLDARSIPEQLDGNTVFTEEDPLVIKGSNLSSVDSLYLNNEKIENLKFVEKSDKELKFAFSVAGNTGDLSFYAKSHFMGVFSSTSAKTDIEVYDSQIQVPVVTELTKNGRTITGDAVRLKEAFTLGIKGEDLPDNAVVYINGKALKDGKTGKGVLNVQIDEDTVKEINEAKKITVQISPETKEGHATDIKSDNVEFNVYERLLDNSWLDNFQGGQPQIMNLTDNMENTKEAVEARLDEYYNQGVRFVKFSPKFNVDLQNVIEYIKNKEDMQLVVDLTGEADKQAIYDTLNEAGIIQSVIGIVDSQASFEEWNSVDKAQDRLRIIFKADNDGMTLQQSLDYWKQYNIKAVSFTDASYWSKSELRNDDRIKEYGISFFCENPANDEERDFMLYPSDYIDSETELQGITGFMTTFVTPESMTQKESALQYAKGLRDFADGSAIKDYLNTLKNSGYTVMFSVKDDGKEIDNIAAELNNLGIHSDVLGAPDAFRNGYVAVVKTHTDGTSELVLEQSKSSEDGVALEADYTAGNGRSFHLKSNGRKDDTDDASPVAEISCGTVNYASNEAGLNIVVYDEANDCIVDRIWYDAWNNQGNDNPPLSKNHGKEWISLKYADKKEERKQQIIEYFNNLAVNKDNYMIIMAVGDEGTSNMDTDIQNAMSQIGVTAAFDGDDSFQKSYVGLFANDLGELSFTNGSNDEFSDMKISLNDFSYDGHTFNVISEGNGLEDSLAQIVMDDQEMTNEQRGLHILVYDKTTHQPVNYTWIDCYDSLKFNSIDLAPQNN